MIRFNHLRVADQFRQLRQENPPLYAMIVAAADYGWREYRQPMVITSIYRPENVASVHAWWRGVDVRIEHPERRVRDEERGWSEVAAREIIDWLPFGYPGEPEIAVIHGEGFHRHVHFQVGYGVTYAGEWE